MELINYEKNDINILLSQAELIFNNYLNAIKDKSNLSNKESEMIQIYYKNILKQLRNLLETLKSTNISLQQIEYNSNQEKQSLESLYNNLALTDPNSQILDTICKIFNELNALSNLPTTTINEIIRKYFLMNNHFMNANYFINNQTQVTKYKKPEKNS